MDPPDDDLPPRADLLVEIADLRARLAESQRLHLASRDELLVVQETRDSHRVALEQLVEAYDELYDFAPVAYLSLDLAGLILAVNRTAEHLLGHDRERLLGRPLRLHVHPEDRRRLLDHLLRCRSGGPARVASELRIAAGARTTPVQVVSQRAGESLGGHVVRTVLVDLTERRAAEDALRRSHQSLALALEAGRAGFYEATWPGGDLTVNPRWGQILGLDPALLPPSRALFEWQRARIDPDDRPARDAALDTFLAGATPSYAAEFRIRDAAGRWVWVRELAEAADRDPARRPTRVVGVMVDISAEKLRLIEARARTAQLEALSEALFRVEENERRELAAQLHDDLGQRLVAVRFRLAAADPATVGPALALLDSIQESVRSLAFQLSPPILHDFGLVAGLRWLAREFFSAFELAVEVEADDLPPLPPDRTYLLFRCVRELLLNTVKHARADLATVVVAAEADRIRIAVEDDGVGFDPAAAAPPSRSFGLLSVRERLGWLGGQVSIDSAAGDGTRVTLVVPLPASVPSLGA